MKPLHIPTLLLLTLLACNERQAPAPRPSHNIEDRRVDSGATTAPFLAMGYRFIVTGDFDGDGQVDTLRERFVDRTTRQETYKLVVGSTDEDSTALRIIAERPLSFIAGDRLDTIWLSTEKWPAYGALFLKNEGDLDGKRGAEISYIIDNLDMSSVNMCRIMTFDRNRWKEIASFEIREWQIPPLPGVNRSYGNFGVESASYEDTIPSIDRERQRALDTFGLVRRVERGVIEVGTFEPDSGAVVRRMNL